MVAVHSLSKRSNLAGLRVGFYAGDAELVTYLKEVRKHVGMMVPGPAQAAGAVALADDAHVEVQRDRYRLPARAAGRRCSATWSGLDVPMPAGGFYLWFDAGDGWAFAERLAREGGALVSPGDFYGAGGAQNVRAAVVQPDDRIELVADATGGAVMSYQPQPPHEPGWSPIRHRCAAARSAGRGSGCCRGVGPWCSWARGRRGADRDEQLVHDAVKGFARAPVGCTTTLEFDTTGTFTLFVETKGTVGRRSAATAPAAVPRTTVATTTCRASTLDAGRTTATTQVTLGDANDYSYDTGGFVGTSYATVDITARRHLPAHRGERRHRLRHRRRRRPERATARIYAGARRPIAGLGAA